MGETTSNPFSELKGALSADEALAEANRCLYCFDAPCTRACPTHIDVPRFIKKIASGNLVGSARTILSANVLGASCARVCPTEELCEGACVLNDLHHKPIKIGQLQRHATDYAMARGLAPFDKGPARGGKVAVIGAGPAGLACAAELLRLGIEPTVLDAAAQPGGLNTTGVAEYKITPEFALEEVAWLKDAGVQIRTGVRVGGSGPSDVSVAEVDRYDAIFIGVGLGKIGKLGIPGEDLAGVVDALDFIEKLKLHRAEAEAMIQKAPRVVVIGGGNTAIDAVTQAVRLGAGEVTLAYRRDEAAMPAYEHEIALARRDGVRFSFLAAPKKIVGAGKVEGIELDRMKLGAPDAGGRRRPEKTGESFTLACDLVIYATGQEANLELLKALPNIKLASDNVVVDDKTGQTSNPKYFAGGDCISGGKEVVNAVAEGKRAAQGILAFLEANGKIAKATKEVARG